jgi:SNF2 family DNA or RNA helicase
MRLLAHQVWAIWFIMQRWIWDADMLRALVADEMGLGKTFSLVSVAMLWKLVTEIVVMELPLYIVWGMTLTE